MYFKILVTFKMYQDFPIFPWASGSCVVHFPTLECCQCYEVLCRSKKWILAQVSASFIINFPREILCLGDLLDYQVMHIPEYGLLQTDLYVVKVWHVFEILVYRFEGVMRSGQRELSCTLGPKKGDHFPPTFGTSVRAFFFNLFNCLTQTKNSCVQSWTIASSLYFQAYFCRPQRQGTRLAMSQRNMHHRLLAAHPTRWPPVL